MFLGCHVASRMSLSRTPASVWRVAAPWVQWSLLGTDNFSKGAFWVFFLEPLVSFLGFPR